jgi:hypothetical protein
MPRSTGHRPWLTALLARRPTKVARQQTRPDGLGDNGQERTLQGTYRSRGVNELAPDSPA